MLQCNSRIHWSTPRVRKSLCSKESQTVGPTSGFVGQRGPFGVLPEAPRHQINRRGYIHHRRHQHHHLHGRQSRFDCVHLHPIHRGHNPNNLIRACGVVTVNEIHVRGGWNFYHMYAYVTPLGLMQIDGRMMLDRRCAPVALLLRSIQPRWVWSQSAIR